MNNLDLKRDLAKLSIGHPKHIQQAIKNVPEYRKGAQASRDELMSLMNGQPNSWDNAVIHRTLCRNLITQLVMRGHSSPKIMERDR